MFEVEVRSFISEEKYKELIDYFMNNSEFINEDNQESYYFDSDQDLRIQRNNSCSKIWLKKGKIHEDCREEIEIKFNKEQFNKLEELFSTLGYNVNIKWFRKRKTFNWQDIKVTIDYTKGYGHIIELEKMSDEKNKEDDLMKLKEMMALLKIPITQKKEFDIKFNYYKENWSKLINEVKK